MNKLIWATDTHWEWVNKSGAVKFNKILEEANDNEEVLAMAIPGDIGDRKVIETLYSFAHRFSKPIYFVLGNHDYYNTSIESRRAQINELCESNENLYYLNYELPIKLNSSVSVIGVDGWGDARYGDLNTTISLCDFSLIAELIGTNYMTIVRGGNRKDLHEKLRELGDAEASLMRGKIVKAFEDSSCKTLVVITHVPPFIESAWHNGRHSNSDWQPYFTCKAVGDVLKAEMISRPDKNMLVLCGHTHGFGESNILPNLKTITGGAIYGTPEFQQALDLDFLNVQGD